MQILNRAADSDDVYFDAQHYLIVCRAGARAAAFLLVNKCNVRG